MLSTLLLVTFGPNSGDDIVIMMSGAKGPTRCASINDGVYCTAGTANTGSSASGRRTGDGCVQSKFSRRWHAASANERQHQYRRLVQNTSSSIVLYSLLFRKKRNYIMIEQYNELLPYQSQPP